MVGNINILLKSWFLPIFLGVALMIGISRLAAEDEDEDMYAGAARFESKTDLNSAECVINNKDQDEDRKRKTLGAGEEVEITLKGKSALVGENTSIEWSIDDESKQYAQFTEAVTKGKRKVKLRVEKNLPAPEATVKVNVKTNALDTPLSIEFTVYRPQAHFDVVNLKTPLDGCPANGDTEHFGASTKLELTVKPLSVSFAKISIREENTDEGAPDPAPSLWAYHNP